MVRVTVPIIAPYDVVIGSGVVDDAAVHLPELPGKRGTPSWWPTAWPARWFQRRDEKPWSAHLPQVGRRRHETLAVCGTAFALATREAHRDDVVVALGAVPSAIWQGSWHRRTCAGCPSCRSRRRSRRRSTRRSGARLPG